MTGSSRSRLAWRCDGKRRRIGDGEPASGGLALQIHHMTDNPKFDLVNAKLTAEPLLGPDFPAYWQALGCFVDRFRLQRPNPPVHAQRHHRPLRSIALPRLKHIISGQIPIALAAPPVPHFPRFVLTVQVGDIASVATASAAMRCCATVSNAASISRSVLARKT
jgi:hypothetical protein